MTRFVRSVVILQTSIILCVIATLLALALRNRMFDRVTFSLDIIALYALLTASYSFADKPTQVTTPARRNITSSRRLPSFFTVLLSVICIVLAFAFPVNHAESIKADAAETSIIQDNIRQYASNHPEQIFILNVVCDEAYVKSHSIFETFKTCRYEDNTIPVVVGRHSPHPTTIFSADTILIRTIGMATSLIVLTFALLGTRSQPTEC